MRVEEEHRLQRIGRCREQRADAGMMSYRW
jgi:hypothetical protein